MSAPSNRRKSAASNRTDATRRRIERMEVEREERRKEMIQKKISRKEESAKLIAAGNPGDVDFIGMVEEWRSEQCIKQMKSLKRNSSVNNNIIVAVRKRPMSDKEREKLDHDSVSCYNPKVWIHSAKFKVDGITKYLTHTGFQFDHTFGEDSSTDQIYVATTMPLVDHVIRAEGRATVFCYGQTGSGKTHTMSGIQKILAHDLYQELNSSRLDVEVRLTFFELYGGFIQDLLHDRKRCKLLEDGKGEVNITGLKEVRASTAAEFLQVIDDGQSERTTRATEANDSSSRSHAICQVFIRNKGSEKMKGKLTLVDLAGSERGDDTKSHDTQRRTESAEINTSLLSLKECIRALGQKNSRVPYRGSKLTLILKDCFCSGSKTTMLAMVSPGASATDHSLNTLRYADRIKEQRISSSNKKREPSTGNGTLKIPEPTKERLLRISNVLNGLNNCDSGDYLQAVKRFPLLNGTDSNDDPSIGSILDCDFIEDKQTVQSQSEVKQGDREEPQHVEIGGDLVYDKSDSSTDEEAQMRSTIQQLFELEESLLDQHITNIKENAEMLRQEDELLISIEKNKQPEDEEMDSYAIQLAAFLEEKEARILSLQDKVHSYKLFSDGKIS